MSALHVEVAYALAEAQHVVDLTLPDGATVADALSKVGTAAGFEGVDLDAAVVGIFGTVITDRSQRLVEGDRVEIYRPLTVDPITARRLRARRRG